MSDYIVSTVAFSRAVGFSGSRSCSASQWRAVELAVSGLCGQPVSVGCAAGVDELVRRLVPSARVFRVSDCGFRGRGAFAARSVACVRSVAVSGGLWVSFPSLADFGCPVGLVPSSSSSRCFSGSGSGSWASLAFAVGCGVRCLVFLPSVCPPAWLSAVPGCPGWFEFQPVSFQLSLF
jgi:hypothetical protein